MFAFLRVIVFYLGFAALLVWGMFALGWADALELPGFEGTRVPVATVPPVVPVAVSSVPVSNSTRNEAPLKSPPPSEARPAAALPEIKPEPKRVVVDTPPSLPAPQAAVPVAPPSPPVRTEVAITAPAAQPQRVVEPPAVAQPSPPPLKEVKTPEAIVAPVVPPPRQPVVVTPPAPPPARTVDAAPVKPTIAPAPAPTPPPQVRAAAPAEPSVKSWAAGYRIAGFGPDALVDLLGDARRARDDIACVMFRNVVFKSGTTVYQPRARAELELVAKVLAENPGQRVELGSRLGPGRPMSTDAKLRTDRSGLVRDDLIALGVAPSRLAIDTHEAYERVAEDVARVKGGRVQSIGVCVHAS